MTLGQLGPDRDVNGRMQFRTSRGVLRSLGVPQYGGETV
jgi:hypothetical protein